MKTVILYIALTNIALANEVNCLAKNIYFESRGESEIGQFLVGFVTNNRVRDYRWPDSYCEVVEQRHQFSWYWDGKSDNPRDAIAWARSKEIANIIYNSSNLDTTHYGFYFKAVYAKSKYFDNLRKLNKVGKHEFFTN